MLPWSRLACLRIYVSYEWKNRLTPDHLRDSQIAISFLMGGQERTAHLWCRCGVVWRSMKKGGEDFKLWMMDNVKRDGF